MKRSSSFESTDLLLVFAFEEQPDGWIRLETRWYTVLVCSMRG